MADAIITLSKADDIMVENSEGDMLRKLQRVIDPSMPDKLEFADFMRVMLALVGDECTQEQLRREWDEQGASNTGLMTIDRLCTLILSPDHYHVPDRLERYLDKRTEEIANEATTRQHAPEPRLPEGGRGQCRGGGAAIAAREEHRRAGNEVAGRARRLLRAAARSGTLRGALEAVGGEDCSQRSILPEVVPLKQRGDYLHVKARSSHPSLPERAHVGDKHVPWSVEWAGYKPPSYSADILRTASWADPADPSRIRAELQSRLSHEGCVKLEPGTGFPINPVGRTGLRDRGILGKWGPNHAADPIVTRFDPSTQRLQVVVIQRSDTGEWALPGGMVDPGETVSQAVKREFTEEAGNFEHDEQKAKEFEHLTGELFASGELVYSGYVDDPRNTDSAWMETAAFHFHCEPQLAEMLQLNAGDDAVKVKWLDVSMEEPDYCGLYASHRDWVDFVASRFKETALQAAPSEAELESPHVAVDAARHRLVSALRHGVRSGTLQSALAELR